MGITSAEQSLMDAIVSIAREEITANESETGSWIDRADSEKIRKAFNDWFAEAFQREMDKRSRNE